MLARGSISDNLLHHGIMLVYLLVIHAPLLAFTVLTVVKIIGEETLDPEYFMKMYRLAQVGLMHPLGFCENNSRTNRPIVRKLGIPIH